MQWKYYVLMYENGKVTLFQEWREGETNKNEERSKFNCDIL
jgi:hypothetical protein